MNRSTFNPLLTPGLATVFFRWLKDVPPSYEKWINVKTSKRAWEEEYKVASIGRYRIKGESAIYQFDEPLPGDTVRYTHLTYGLGFRVSQEMMEDDLYGIATRMGQELGRSARINKEVQAYSVLNNGFNAAFTGFDSKQLFIATHDHLDGTQESNLATGDLDLPNIQAAVELFLSWEDDRSVPVESDPSMLLFGPTNVWVAHEILESEFRPTDADNAKNIVRSKFGIKPMMVRWLTDADSWFLLASKANHDLKMWRRTGDQFRKADDPFNGDKLYFGRHRLSVGFSDYHGAVGSAGA